MSLPRAETVLAAEADAPPGGSRGLVLSGGEGPGRPPRWPGLPGPNRSDRALIDHGPVPRTGYLLAAASLALPVLFAFVPELSGELGVLPWMLSVIPPLIFSYFSLFQLSGSDTVNASLSPWNLMNSPATGGGPRGCPSSS